MLPRGRGRRRPRRARSSRPGRTRREAYPAVGRRRPGSGIGHSHHSARQHAGRRTHGHRHGLGHIAADHADHADHHDHGTDDHRCVQRRDGGADAHLLQPGPEGRARGHPDRLESSVPVYSRFDELTVDVYDNVNGMAVAEAVTPTDCIAQDFQLPS
ncbi:MAG: hypothetical protein ABSE98_09220 [Acidimicrobiales bacterium]